MKSDIGNVTDALEGIRSKLYFAENGELQNSENPTDTANVDEE